MCSTVWVRADNSSWFLATCSSSFATTEPWPASRWNREVFSSSVSLLLPLFLLRTTCLGQHLTSLLLQPLNLSTNPRLCPSRLGGGEELMTKSASWMRLRGRLWVTAHCSSSRLVKSARLSSFRLPLLPAQPSQKGRGPSVQRKLEVEGPGG